MSKEASTVVGGAALALGACGGSDGQGTAATTPTQLSAKAQAGKALFFDTSLSASGRQSCGTCHVPARALTADPATDSGLPMPEIDDLVAFLCTLTDGFDPKNPAAYNLPAQCAPGAE